MKSLIYVLVISSLTLTSDAVLPEWSTLKSYVTGSKSLTETETATNLREQFMTAYNNGPPEVRMFFQRMFEATGSTKEKFGGIKSKLMEMSDDVKHWMYKTYKDITSRSKEETVSEPKTFPQRVYQMGKEEVEWMNTIFQQYTPSFMSATESESTAMKSWNLFSGLFNLHTRVESGGNRSTESWADMVLRNIVTFSLIFSILFISFRLIKTGYVPIQSQTGAAPTTGTARSKLRKEE
jgi:hypothetical protein